MQDKEYPNKELVAGSHSLKDVHVYVIFQMTFCWMICPIIRVKRIVITQWLRALLISCGSIIPSPTSSEIICATFWLILWAIRCAPRVGWVASCASSVGRDTRYLITVATDCSCVSVTAYCQWPCPTSVPRNQRHVPFLFIKAFYTLKLWHRKLQLWPLRIYSD